ncbi:MAG: hypothetical protein FWH44_02870 [Methanomassiliicoccaceae archaeon]|nr:hypothetical protein [Methanomassiliicoccaceae archaeon]
MKSIQIAVIIAAIAVTATIAAAFVLTNGGGDDVSYTADDFSDSGIDDTPDSGDDGTDDGTDDPGSGDDDTGDGTDDGTGDGDDGSGDDAGDDNDDAGDGDDDGNDDGYSNSEYIGQYAKYSISSSPSRFKGTLTIEVTDATSSQLQYMFSWNITGPIGILPLYSDSSKQWADFGEGDTFASPLYKYAGDPEGEATLSTIHGIKTTVIYMAALGGQEAKMWVGKDNGIVYRIETVIDGTKITCTLTGTNIK